MADKVKIEEDIYSLIAEGVTTKVAVAERIIESRRIESFEVYEIIDEMVNGGQLIKENETVGDFELKESKG
ncbi:hypothetical protein [Alkalicoccobacillus gibsonii]|uniref:hypothetical protein n=1 Tax=Alkalicoccobacillus gibsonii TaxID=79881 RepID=UPI001933A3A1|nr:hypothetical protein [Alkalicoccobacillus gibsonii]MBM0066283.1 hypothetical protein [Alkalicoccobacillus gibsonii]